MHTYRLKGASGKVANQAFGLAERSVLGAADDCELRIEEASVAPHHAEILLGADGGLLLNSLDSGFETLVNGKIAVQVQLFSGDEIRIGSCRWVVQAPGLRPEKILHETALQPKRSLLPWLIATALLAGAALAWQRGWLPF